MQIANTLAAMAVLLLAPAFAQSTTTQAIITTTTTGSAPATTTTSDVAGLVSQLPECALGCLSSAATDIGCNAADLTCLCSKSSDLISSIAPCILISSGCSDDQQSQISSLATSICNNVNNSNSSDIASASNYITSALATMTSGSASTTSASGNAALPTGSPVAGMGFIGAAAALAALAL
ncbi:hypothetical protein SLS53_001710 [Cytospora paraplurivora]|uniref:CFEM domain-containing protein n=1 Tax=Cytospora paraplurivora TaxID=2898453 RepID=A0AAN9YM83_9PEZI